MLLGKNQIKNDSLEKFKTQIFIFLFFFFKKKGFLSIDVAHLFGICVLALSFKTIIGQRYRHINGDTSLQLLNLLYYFS